MSMLKFADLHNGMDVVFVGVCVDKAIYVDKTRIIKLVHTDYHYNEPNTWCLILDLDNENASPYVQSLKDKGVSIDDTFHNEARCFSMDDYNKIISLEGEADIDRYIEYQKIIGTYIYNEVAADSFHYGKNMSDLFNDFDYFDEYDGE